MPDDDISVEVAAAVAAIRKATDVVSKPNSGIGDAQIRELRNAIDELELRLNAEKQKLDAARS